MWFFLLIFLGFVINFFIATKKDWWDEWWEGIAYLGSIWGVIGVILFYPILGFTTGLFENYSNGERQGYLTKISQKGVIYKTWEGQMQIGTGQLAALQEPFEFSIDNNDLVILIKENMGKKIRIEYIQWVITPFRIGENQHIITKLELLE